MAACGGGAVTGPPPPATTSLLIVKVDSAVPVFGFLLKHTAFFHADVTNTSTKPARDVGALTEVVAENGGRWNQFQWKAYSRTCRICRATRLRRLRRASVADRRSRVRISRDRSET